MFKKKVAGKIRKKKGEEEVRQMRVRLESGPIVVEVETDDDLDVEMGLEELRMLAREEFDRLLGILSKAVPMASPDGLIAEGAEGMYS